MSSRSFHGKVPEPGEPTPEDQLILDLIPAVLNDVAEHIEAVELRAGLRSAMDAAGAVNAYLNSTEPWKAQKDDPTRAGTILWTAIQAISAIRIALSPYLPFSTETIGTMLGVGAEVRDWTAQPIQGGTSLGPVSPVFVKLEPDALDD
jgi:methionyl-tRNA synthetase